MQVSKLAFAEKYEILLEINQENSHFLVHFWTESHGKPKYKARLQNFATLNHSDKMIF